MIEAHFRKLLTAVLVAQTCAIAFGLHGVAQAQAVTDDGGNVGIESVEPADEAGSSDITMPSPEPTPVSPHNSDNNDAPPQQGYSNSSSNHLTIQEQVREARRKGYILPYSVVLQKLSKSVAGKVIKVWFDKHGGRFWSYEFVVLQDNGRMLRVSMMASTAKITRIARR